MKKMLSLVLALMLMLSMMPAALANDNFNADGELPLFKEKVKLTIGVPANANVIDFNTNDMTLYYEELTNVDLEFVAYTSEMNTQLTMAITAGTELPDILFTKGVSTDLMYQWAQAGALLPLNEYIEKYGHYTADAIERTGADFISMMTSPDGNVYTLPSFNQSLTNECMDRIWFYRPWLEKLNLEVPTNAEELYNVLKAFKEQDPNGNGEADEIPLMSHNSQPGVDGESDSWWRAIMNMFMYYPMNNYSVNDGVVSYAAISDSYREGLKYIRKLFDEGLIDPMSFTADEAQLKALVTAEVPVIGMTVGYDAEVTLLSEEDKLWVMASPFKNAEGEMQTSFRASVPKPITMITADCDDPEAAFRFCDFLYNLDHCIAVQFGMKGPNWVWASEGDTSRYYYLSDGYEPTFRTIDNPFGTVQNACWHSTGHFARAKNIAAGSVMDITDEIKLMDELKQNVHYADYFNAYPEEGEYIPMLIYTAEETDAVAMIRADLESYLNTARTAFMLNKDGMDVYSDEAWNAYLEQCKVIGIDKVTEVMQSAYDRMYK